MRIFFSIFFMLPLVVSSELFAQEQLPNLKIKKIEEGIYLHTSYKNYQTSSVPIGGNGLIFIDDNDAYIIDTPSSQKDTAELLRWLAERNYKAKASISSHFHDESSAGIELLNSQSIETYASIFTNKLLLENGKAQALNVFEGNQFWLVKDKIEVFYPGAGHSPDNVVIWLAEPKVLFVGYFAKYKNLGNLSDIVIDEWAESVDKVIARYPNAKHVVTGHTGVDGFSSLTGAKNLSLSARKYKKQNNESRDRVQVH